MIGGLFVNHLFAKAGLFWLAGIIRRDTLVEWSILRRKPHLLFVFALLLLLLSGWRYRGRDRAAISIGMQWMPVGNAVADRPSFVNLAPIPPLVVTAME